MTMVNGEPLIRRHRVVLIMEGDSRAGGREYSDNQEKWGCGRHTISDDGGQSGEEENSGGEIRGIAGIVRPRSERTEESRRSQQSCQWRVQNCNKLYGLTAN